MSLLDIQNLRVEFGAKGRAFRAVDGLDLQLDQGQVLGIVGESGSGKSVAMMAVMGLLAGQGQVSADRLRFDGKDLQTISDRQRRKLLGKDMAMIFQDPMTSLNPSFTVGFQIEEVLREHMGLRGAAARARAIELLQMVEIPGAAHRLESYPHQFSGGMAQRVMIAMAIACNPKLLIADEPTTALDVTIQAQIMELLVQLQRAHNMALILITHDLAVVAEVAQRVAVMYAGQEVEQGAVERLFTAPAHPYTHALLSSVPEHSRGARRLHTLPGIVPGQFDRPTGCLLSPRCPKAQDRCHIERPELLEQGDGLVRCFFPMTAQETL
ncbi:MAG TPA: dipeptide ABC transporter ATP-binding protein DppD [Hydrogenophaga sp.]|jgi:dipeptide transport system ATP-binding protein|uniref:ABC transporter ATP-binding protein n=1 Tax=Hydrogenophaga sp. TaxID=1904254 RepID=UPI0008AF3486|nr:ABC transporter ATP-binding protein [Hydrogenophaga sp.]MBU4181546.1 ABC transporter ATP-binding protein [Gammaproteobacteria bacterium]OGA74574.1 MAG: dipeptide ABC transporter ATP-binding protein DppD [Burkholderiales bacterium GWE1_65_30]OGA94105.1 MAG: dipeptide ABC transporter ATP-binding protein DppD [Burkholderiales bacterium GWF1_66_17]MBU4282827.1 ABC transporter ATP-binding protein [Gammaproteobacteria bacterium]MBU4324973.1 ABC transporter ATP-binding protein [Gammaproteobacteria